MKEFNYKVIKQLRKRRGYTLEQVRRFLNTRTGSEFRSRSAMCHWERGENFPSIKSLILLANFYGIDDMNVFFKDTKSKVKKKRHREVSLTRDQAEEILNFITKVQSELSSTPESLEYFEFCRKIKAVVKEKVERF